MTCLTGNGMGTAHQTWQRCAPAAFRVAQTYASRAAEKHAARCHRSSCQANPVEVRDGIAEGTDVEACLDIAEETDAEVRDDIAEGTDVEACDGIAEGLTRRVHSHEPRFRRTGCGREDSAATNMSADAVANAGKRPRRPWRGTAAEQHVSCQPAAALLIWWQTDETASSGSSASPDFR